jgi:RNA polymerase primary sigma factor
MARSIAGPGGAVALSPLTVYLQEISRTPLLTPAQERQLTARVRDGDAQARDHLVRANLRLVVCIARRYAGRGLGLPDLIAEGNLGLLRAVEAFDPSVEIPFGAYASYWIHQAIRRALVNTARAIRLPAYLEQLLAEWRRAATRLRKELGREPTEDEVAAQLRLPRRRLALVKRAVRIDQGLPQTGRATGATVLEDLLADEANRGPDAGLVLQEEVRRVLGQLERLQPRQATVLRLRFGLGGEGPLTLQRVGERLGLTRERVRQLERDALCELAERLHGGGRAEGTGSACP